jgi:hypothetical protein
VALACKDKTSATTSNALARLTGVASLGPLAGAAPASVGASKTPRCCERPRMARIMSLPPTVRNCGEWKDGKSSIPSSMASSFA